MTTSQNDCYFFYYSTCTKGNSCPFRHEPAALGREELCSAWLRGCCVKEGCQDRHMIIDKNRTHTPCFWESQPGGCQKPHCVFFHKKMPQPPQAVVTIPTVPKPPAQEKKAVPTFGVVVPQKHLADPITAVASSEVPAKMKPIGRQEVSTTYQEDVKAPSTNQTSGVEHVTGGRTVVNGSKAISPMKVVEVKKHVRERITGLNSNSACTKTVASSSVTTTTAISNGIVVKTLEQIHRDKALASMKRRQDDDDVPDQKLGNEGVTKTELPSVGRKIVLRKGRNSDGEISDGKDSPNRKVEVTSDTENGRVRVQGSVKSRLGAALVSIKAESRPSSGASSPADIVVPPVTEEPESAHTVRIKITPRLMISPLKKVVRKRKQEDVVGQSEPSKKPTRSQVAGKVKPDLQIYRPPRASNSATTTVQQEQQQQPLRPKSAVVANVKSKVSLPAKKDVDVKEATSNKVGSLLKKPMRKDKGEERRPLGEVKIKSLDEILADKQKKKSIDAMTIPSVNRSTPVASNRPARMLKRKSDSPDARTPPKDSLAEHSNPQLLKRTRQSVDSDVAVERNGTTEKEVVEDRDTSVPRASVPKMTKQESRKDDDDVLSLDEDSLFADEFLLDDITGSYPAGQSINDDELFKEIELLLE